MNWVRWYSIQRRGRMPRTTFARQLFRCGPAGCGQTGSWQRCWQRHFWGFLMGCCQLWQVGVVRVAARGWATGSPPPNSSSCCYGRQFLSEEDSVLSGDRGASGCSARPSWEARRSRSPASQPIQSVSQPILHSVLPSTVWLVKGWMQTPPRCCCF